MRARKLALLLAVVLLTVVCADPVQAREKRALLIGVNDYVKGPAQWDLRGCENDVALTRELLVNKFGFPPENVRVLLSAEATSAGIKAAIEDWLIDRTQPDDIVYFHFSGHGSQLKDADGDEEDGRDEMICPADMEQGKVESIITDDELRALFDRIPAQNVTIVLDACHSGTGTRDITRSRARFVNFESGSTDGDRAIVVTSSGSPAAKPPKPSPTRIDRLDGKLAGSGGMESGRKLRVTISGCRPDQTSADAWIDDGFYAGALTYNLIENMKKAPPDITYRELMERVVRDIKAAEYSQIPQIEGDMDRPLFGTPITDAVSVPFLVVRAVEGNQVELNGGRAQKVTPGSIYALFGPEETEFTGAGLGRIKVGKVDQTRSQAFLLDRVEVREGYRAKEVLHNLDAARLKLLIEDGGIGIGTQFAAALEQLGFVAPVKGGAHFDQRLQISAGAGGWQAALTFDGVPSAVVSGASPTAVVEGLRPQLENAYTIKYLSTLDNPNAPFGVRLWANRAQIEEKGLKKLDQAPDEKLVEAKVGDAIRFNFVVDKDCYLTLINVGTSGKITVLFPNQYRPDGFVKGGRLYQTETKGEMPFRIRAKGPAGRELVKVIATLDPLDLSSLKMGEKGGAGTRSIESGSRFARQLGEDLAVEGQGAELLPTDRWATDYLIIETEE